MQALHLPIENDETRNNLCHKSTVTNLIYNGVFVNR